MAGKVTLGSIAMVAAIVVLATAVLMVWVISGSRAEGTPLGERILQAAAGDGVDLDGVCFARRDGLIVTPDPDELSRQVREQGRNARLSRGREAAPSATALAERTKGELIGVDNGDAYLLYVGDGARRVDTYSRYESSEGDAVWIRTGSVNRTPCGDD
jgi:hypothetical protein